MIYWERVNPQLGITLDRRMAIWVWEDPEGWTEDGDLDPELPWSPVLTGAQAAAKIHDCIVPPEHIEPSYVDHLVIYGRDGNNWKIILLGFENSLVGFKQDSPDWWLGDLSPMQIFLLRVRIRLEDVTKLVTKIGVGAIGELRTLQENVPGYCLKCGLPLTKHASHEPPGVVKPENNAPSSAWNPYFRAYAAHYRGALSRLSEDELLRMPLPFKKSDLKILILEIEYRLDPVNQVEPKGRLERLLGDDDLLGD